MPTPTTPTPPTPPTPPVATRLAAAAATGVATAAYYATPDLIRSRTARGWAKVALSAVLVAVSVPDAVRTRDQARAHRASLPEEERVDLREAVGTMSTRGKVVGSVVGLGLVGGSIASVVVVERWIFRRGEARAAAGRSYPHTRGALVLGALMAALTLIPDPPQEPVRG
ncbi:hypothetical protein [Cellulomonas sp. Marseille-Q8402]